MSHALEALNAFDEAVVRIAMRRLKGQTTAVDTLFDYLKKLDLTPGHFAVFGSGPLIVRGWVQGINDLGRYLSQYCMG